MVDSSHRSWQAVTRSQRDARHKRQNVSTCHGQALGGGEGAVALTAASPWLSLQLLRLRSVAGRRGTRVCLLPQGMCRHKWNTSRTVWREER